MEQEIYYEDTMYISCFLSLSLLVLVLFGISCQSISFAVPRNLSWNSSICIDNV